MDWYSHPKLLTLKLTKLPPGYPTGFTFPPGVTPNTADYFDRGWCACARYARALLAPAWPRSVAHTHRGSRCVCVRVQVLLRVVRQRHGQGL